MEGEEWGGLSDGVVLAAYALQNEEQDNRRASSTSSVGSEGFYAPFAPSRPSAGAGVGGATRSPPPRQPACPASPPASLSSPASPSKVLPPGSLSPSASPAKRSPLGISQRGAQSLGAAAPFSQGPPPNGCPPEQPAEPYQQYQVLSSILECTQHHPAGEAMQAHAAHAAAGAGAEASGSRQLKSLPSFAFTPPAAEQARGPSRCTTAGDAAPAAPAVAPPRSSAVAAGLAAAAATQQMLAAEEQRRQQAAEQQRQQRWQQDVGRRGSQKKQKIQEGAEEVEEAAGTPSAGMAEAEADDEDGLQAKGGRSCGPSRQHTDGTGDTTDVEDLGLEALALERSPPWYRRWTFWGRLLSLTISLAFFISGVVTLVVWPDAELARFSVWRWCFFLGCWPIIYWASKWAMWGLTRVCEWRLFAARTAIYFLVGTRGALMLVLRSSLVLATFAALFQSQPGKDTAAVQHAFKVILKVLCCVVLVTVANLIKKVLIKLMSTHHHREAHFGRMQEALRKEYFLSVLTQPREPRGSMLSCGDSQAALGQSWGGSPRPKSFAKRWLSRQMLSKSMAALHSLPSLAARSFSRRNDRHRSLSDSLLVEGSQLSDGQHMRAGASGSGAGGGPAVAGVEKSNRSVNAALSSVRVVVGAGVEPSFKSMPNLVLSPGTRLPIGRKAQALALQEQQQQHEQQWQQPVQNGGSRLAPAAAAAGTAARASEQQQLSGIATGAAPVSAAAAQPVQRLSLASRHLSVLSGHSGPHSISFRQAPSKAPSVLSLRSALTAGGSRAPPPLVALLDLERAPQHINGGAQGPRRSSIVEMPPEELEKMHHIEKHIRKNQLKVGLVDRLGHMKHHAGNQNGVDEQEARRVAYFLFHNLRASRKRNWIQQSDLEDFLPPAQAAEAFLYLDIDGNGRISQSEVRDSVLKIFQERTFLASTLRDTRSVIAKLERVLGGILHTLFCFFYLYIFGIDVTQAWLTFSSIMLAFTFIFGNSIRTIFECCVWLFVVHPYDVGDTLVLQGGEHHRVEEIALLNTVLVRFDGARLYCPNSRLSTEPQLTNLTRSSKKSESLKLTLDMSTPLEVVDMLRCTVHEHVKAYPQEFTGASSVNVRGLGDPMKLTLNIWYEFTHNGVDMGRCSRARSALYMVVASALNAANVNFTLPPFASTDVVTKRAHAALEAQPELAAGMGLPPFPGPA